MCGADNRYAEDDAEFCGAGRGCSYNEWIDWEGCTDVAPWQCFVECGEGEVLSPLRYCHCIAEYELYDMFCDPEPEFFDRVSAFEPQALPSFDFTPPPLFDLPVADFAFPDFDFDDLIFEEP